MTSVCWMYSIEFPQKCLHCSVSWWETQRGCWTMKNITHPAILPNLLHHQNRLKCFTERLTDPELRAIGINSPKGRWSGTSVNTCHLVIPAEDGGISGYSSLGREDLVLFVANTCKDVIPSSLLILQILALPNPGRDLVSIGRLSLQKSHRE